MLDIVLAVACCLLAVAVTVLGATLPLLWGRQFKTEAEVAQLRKDADKLDEVLSAFLEKVGVPKVGEKK